MSDLVLSGLIVGIFIMLFFTPFMMCKGICSLEGSLSTKDKVLSIIPIVNIIYAERKYKGKIGLVVISTILLFAGIAFRVFVWYNMYNNVTMGLVSMGVFWFVVLLFIIANMSFVYMVIHDADVLPGGPLVLYTIAFPFGQYYIGTCLANVVKHRAEQEDTFKG